MCRDTKMKGNVKYLSYLRFASKAAFIPLDSRSCTERTNNKHVLKYLLRCTRLGVIVEIGYKDCPCVQVLFLILPNAPF